jgi:excisionase family DNA binding protein
MTTVDSGKGMQDNPEQPRLMVASRAADYLGISLATLAQLERRGFISPYRTPGGHRRYSRQMLDEYLESSRHITYNRAS